MKIFLSYIESFKDRKRALTFVSDTLFLVLVVLVVKLISIHQSDTKLIEDCRSNGYFHAATFFEGTVTIKCEEMKNE